MSSAYRDSRTGSVRLLYFQTKGYSTIVTEETGNTSDPNPIKGEMNTGLGVPVLGKVYLDALTHLNNRQTCTCCCNAVLLSAVPPFNLLQARENN